MKTILVLLLFLPILLFGQTKAERYQIYLNNCNAPFTLTFDLSGYLKYDTIRVKAIPTKGTYYGKVIVASIKISSTAANIVTVDSIWNKLTICPYASEYNYYHLQGKAVPISTTPDVSYTGKRLIFKTKTYIIKTEKPLSYTAWNKYINKNLP